MSVKKIKFHETKKIRKRGGKVTFKKVTFSVQLLCTQNKV